MVSKYKRPTPNARMTPRRPLMIKHTLDIELLAHKAKMARTAAPTMLPKVTPVEEPLFASSGAVGAAEAAMVAEAPALPATGVVAAGTAAGVPGTRTGAAVVAAPAAGVEKTTCGTVMTVEMAVVVDEDGITRPEDTPVDSTHGTVTMVWIEIVVTGTVGADVTVGLLELGHPVTIAGF